MEVTSTSHNIKFLMYKQLNNYGQPAYEKINLIFLDDRVLNGSVLFPYFPGICDKTVDQPHIPYSSVFRSCFEIHGIQ